MAIRLILAATTTAAGLVTAKKIQEIAEKETDPKRKRQFQKERAVCLGSAFVSGVAVVAEVYLNLKKGN